ncbi:MAG: glycosyltransferase 87 family protein [Actinomycetota bacterium]
MTRATSSLRAHPAAVVTGAIGGLGAMAVMGATPGSPYQPVLTPSGRPTGPLRELAVAIGLADLRGTALITVSTLIAFAATGAFLLLLREAFRGHVGVRQIAVVVVLGHLVLLFVPLLFSRDVYSYSYYGRIAGIYGGNPYLETPLDHSEDPLWDYVGPKWVDTPAVYGPAWTSLSAGLSRLLSRPGDQVAAYRYLAIAASLATCAVIVSVVRRRRPERAAFALAAFGANPVVLFHSVASGHNDLFVALAIAGGLALVLRGRERWAVAVLTLGALIKVTGVLPLALLVLWCVARRPRSERAHALGVLVAIAAGIGAALSIPYLQWHDPSLGMARLATHEGWLAPSMAFSRVLEYLTFDVVTFVPRLVFAAILVTSLVWLGRGVARRGAALTFDGLAAAWGWALVLLTLLGPVLLPWYVVWSLPLVWVLPRPARTLLITTASLLAVTLWSTEPLRFPVAFGVDTFLGRWVVTPVMIVLLVRAVRDLRTRLEVGLPLDDDEAVSAGVGGAPPEPREQVAAGTGEG